MTVLEPQFVATRWAVSCLPEDHAGYRRSIVTIEQRGPDSYSVAYDGFVHDAKGTPEVEPLPSDRSAEWLARFRHDYPAAAALAARIARIVAVSLTG
ncbi:hypothetical protein [Nocardia sp. A7]|uniref:hypothetical protein n=1 Tax=Nocardia sp. A7 TaxID=2789274 RepID=UPI0039784EE2